MTEKGMCICVNGGNGVCVEPSFGALAVLGGHGQSRGTIMSSQEGLFHRALLHDHLCCAQIQRNNCGCLEDNSSGKQQSQKLHRITLPTNMLKSLTNLGFTKANKIESIIKFRKNVNDSFPHQERIH